MKTKILMWLGVILLIITGLVHLYLVQEEFEEAAYIGVLFFLNFLGSFIAAVGVLRGQAWGWLLGLLVTSGSVAAYILSRTAGLPGHPAEEWTVPSGLLSLAAEILFVILVFVVWPSLDLRFPAALPALPRYSTPMAAMLTVTLLGIAGFFWQTRVVPITQADLEEKYGLQVSLVATTMMESVVDVRLKILDVEKAERLLDDRHDENDYGATGPSLLVGDREASILEPARMHHPHILKDEDIYFMFYPNTDHIVKTGTPVSLVFGNYYLEPIASK